MEYYKDKECENSLEMHVNPQRKELNIWLTRAEAQNVRLSEGLRPVYQAYHDMGYFVAVFSSGSGSLADLTGELLRNNCATERAGSSLEPAGRSTG